MRINIFSYLIFTMFITSITFCTNQHSNNTQNGQSANNQKVKETPPFKYDLMKPIKKIKLPDELVEISALSYYGPGLLLTVQDEKADVFTIDFHNEQIVNHYVSSKSGDYEGIEAVGENVYLLKSSGTIIEHKNFGQENHEIFHYNTALNVKNDAEGLAYSASTNSLLIACKGRAWIKDATEKPEDKRYIYSFSLVTKTLEPKPTLCIDLKELKKDFGVENFMPSAIAIHPVDSSYYVLSAVGNLLIVMNRIGKIQRVEKLDHSVFRQPEGICFSPDGEFLFISNEGRSKKGNILQFAKQ